MNAFNLTRNGLLLKLKFVKEFAEKCAIFLEHIFIGGEHDLKATKLPTKLPDPIFF